MDNNFKNIEKKILTTVKNHYENFPVASFLIPKYYRKDIAIVYWFARTADDISDEGNNEPYQRLYELNKFEEEFKNSLKGFTSNLNFIILAKTISEKILSTENFFNLLSAFKQDVVKKRYKSFKELSDYCKRSANPVGRILLEIFRVKEEEAIISSDKICTALQLTNFFQDTVIDFEKGRIYYPQEELRKFSVTENMFELKQNNPNIKALVKYNVDRTQSLFDEGKSLLKYLSGRFKYEIKWTIAGGEKILDKIRKNEYDVFTRRPKLSKIDYITLLMRNIF